MVNTRKHYIDNLRWMILLILIPYHAAMAWNVWEEPNYIYFEGNRAISSIVVFCSPFFMPLLFLLAGVGTKFALQKRSYKAYLTERVNRLFVPLLFGTLVFMPIMTYLADKFHSSYSGSFGEHYAVFFTKYTDLTGADGGFSLGQFWFLLYLLIVSALGIGMIALQKRCIRKSELELPLWGVLVLGIPLPFLCELLSIGGKSLMEYLYFFLLGYYVFSNDKAVQRLEKNWLLLCCIGVIASIMDVYLFLWSKKDLVIWNTVAKYVAEWVLVLALIGLSKRFLDFSGKLPVYMQRRSILFYIYHFIWVVFFQYLLYGVAGNNTVILFGGTVLLSYLATFICCEISIRVPLLCKLTGTKCVNK